MKKFIKIDDIISGKEKSPLPLEVIPNYMGINLCSVDSIEFTRRDDGQLVDFRINFNPEISGVKYEG